MKKALVVFATIFCSVRAAEFLYPIHTLSADLIYLIYQKTPHHIELWDWHPSTGRAEQILMSRFTPAGVQLLPSKTAYSFIDNGIVHIKAAHKRSPKSLELDAPITHVELVSWITDSELYTSAQYRGRFGIFHITADGEVFPVALDEDSDFQYPCKVGDFLFYIEQSRGGYQIVRTTYRAQGLLKGEFRERVRDYYACRLDFEKAKIANFGLQPIVFLKMVSQSEGFVLEHQKAVSKRDISISFVYHRIRAHEDPQKQGTHVWTTEKLFSFTIPSEFLLPGKKKRLYEALLPFLPRHNGNEIIVSSAGEGTSLNLFFYDQVRGGILRQHSSSSHLEDQFFAPLILPDGRILYGGQLHEHSHSNRENITAQDQAKKQVQNCVEMMLTDHGITVDLPVIL